MGLCTNMSKLEISVAMAIQHKHDSVISYAKYLYSPKTGIKTFYSFEASH